jgi:hypothetical protein
MALAWNEIDLPELFCIAIILTGVAIALAPGDHAKIPPRQLWLGLRSRFLPPRAARSARC